MSQSTMRCKKNTGRKGGSLQSQQSTHGRLNFSSLFWDGSLHFNTIPTRRPSQPGPSTQTKVSVTSFTVGIIHLTANKSQPL